MGDYLLDSFVYVSPGQPYRLFPYGKITRGGKTRVVDPATQFSLPHFKPAIKLGSHDDATPAGGFIVALESRADGLYAVPEFNESGIAAMAAGAYRYHSPEVLWEGGIEDVTTGETIPAPLILGDALLHMPALGEAAALYQIEEVDMTVETVQVPKNIWEKFTAWFERRLEPETQPEPEPEPEPAAPVIDPEQFDAIQAERDQYKAQIERMEADAAAKARLDNYAAKLAQTKAAPEAAMLAGMTDEQADWVLQQFAALSAQINEGALTGEIGSEGEALPEGQMGLNERINAYAAEHKITYLDAVTALAKAEPGLFVK
jgi:hypothetical protein